MLDLFAGSGAVGLEAVSRGAPEAWFVEKHSAVLRTLRENLKNLGVPAEQGRVVAGDVASFLRRKGPVFDLVFIDPPYGRNLAAPTLSALLQYGRLSPDGIVAAEIETSLDFDPHGSAPGLECATDRTYGQTRIVIWRMETRA